ncbi:MAG: hypothetical protein EBU70_09750, partial [Actinobacteria bacterium]|nr:hypothetical protein [Actinomycetota bacterium]
MELLSNGTNVLLILAGFGLLIFVHELGHFLAARWAGIRCESFAVGMGPPILAWRRGIGLRAGSTDPSTIARHGKPAVEMTDEELERNGLGETEWSLRAFPLGGFVKMLGQDDLDPSHVSSSRRSYQRAPLGRRMVVVSAGVTANLLLAVTLFVVAFMVGVRFEAPLVGMVVPGSPAANAKAEDGRPDGLRAGDELLAIDGEPVETFADIQIAGAMARPGSTLEFTVVRQEDGGRTQRRLRVTPERDRASGLYAIGIAPALSGAVGKVAEGERAAFDEAMARAGLAPERTSAGEDALSDLLVVRAGRADTTGVRDLHVRQTVASGDSADGPAAVLASAALDRAAEESGGAPFVTQWRTKSGKVVERAISPIPRFQEIADAASPGAAPDAGLLGLVPLLRIERPAEGSPNAAVFRPGDVILRAGDAQGPRLGQLREALSSRAGGTIPMVVLRDGRETPIEARVGANGLLGVQIVPALDLPVTAAPITSAATTGGTPRATPAAGLDLLPRTRIEAIGGTAVSDWASIRSALADATRE